MGEKIMHITYRGAEKGRQQISLEAVHSRGEEKTVEDTYWLLTKKEFISGKNIFDKVKWGLPQLYKSRANVSVYFRKDQKGQAEGYKQKEGPTKE